MPVMGTVKFQRFFRAAAGLQVDRNDLKRYTDFIDDKIYDVILIGKASAKANLRDVIEPWDLPITKGLQESIHRFEKLDEEIELQPLLDQLTAPPALGRGPLRGDRATTAADRRRVERSAGANFRHGRTGPQEPRHSPMDSRLRHLPPTSVITTRPG